MFNLREYLNTGMESEEEKEPRREERKGWIILRFDPSTDDLSLIDQERLDEWKEYNNLLVVIELGEEEALQVSEREAYKELQEKLDDIGTPHFKDEDELEDYLQREHRPEMGEA